MPKHLEKSILHNHRCSLGAWSFWLVSPCGIIFDVFLSLSPRTTALHHKRLQGLGLYVDELSNRGYRRAARPQAVQVSMQPSLGALLRIRGSLIKVLELPIGLYIGRIGSSVLLPTPSAQIVQIRGRHWRRKPGLSRLLIKKDRAHLLLGPSHVNAKGEADKEDSESDSSHMD